MHNNDKKPAVRVWDLPVRLFHWLLVAAFVTAWLTRSDRYLHIHVFAGYLIAGLLLFRLVWGIAGSRYARFRNFAYGYRSVMDYLARLATGRAPHFLGHNPAGSWAVFALLALIALVTLSGVITLGGEERHGPVAGWLTFRQGDIAHATHEFLAWALLALTGIHVIGVAVESILQRENLVRSMLTGLKFTDHPQPDAPARRAAGFVLLAGTGAAFLLYFQGAIFAPAGKPYLPFEGPALADDAQWRQECGSCHLAYHPSLLPGRSWQAMMAGQNTHFDEDLALDPETVKAITGFLVANASESAPTEAAWKIGKSVSANETPQRVTTTAYWKAKHDFAEDVWRSPDVKGRHDCAACHLDADKGTFEDGAMHLPATGKTIITRR